MRLSLTAITVASLAMVAVPAGGAVASEAATTTISQSAQSQAKPKGKIVKKYGQRCKRKNQGKKAHIKFKHDPDYWKVRCKLASDGKYRWIYWR